MMFIGLVCLGVLGPNPWSHSLGEAKKVAQEKHQFILLNFSGSDWCGPCIRLHKEILDSQAFLDFANGQLVLIQADFPRQKRNQLPKEQQVENDRLYHWDSVFVFYVLDWSGNNRSYISNSNLAVH